jgi:hypothetical protein
MFLWDFLMTRKLAWATALRIRGALTGETVNSIVIDNRENSRLRPSVQQISFDSNKNRKLPKLSFWLTLPRRLPTAVVCRPEGLLHPVSTQ